MSENLSEAPHEVEIVHPFSQPSIFYWSDAILDIFLWLSVMAFGIVLVYGAMRELT